MLNFLSRNASYVLQKLMPVWLVFGLFGFWVGVTAGVGNIEERREVKSWNRLFPKNISYTTTGLVSPAPTSLFPNYFHSLNLQVKCLSAIIGQRSSRNRSQAEKRRCWGLWGAVPTVVALGAPSRGSHGQRGAADASVGMVVTWVTPVRNLKLYSSWKPQLGHPCTTV